MKIRIAINAAMKHAARLPIAALQASRKAFSRLNPPLYSIPVNPKPHKATSAFFRRFRP